MKFFVPIFNLLIIISDVPSALNAEASFETRIWDGEKMSLKPIPAYEQESRESRTVLNVGSFRIGRNVICSPIPIPGTQWALLYVCSLLSYRGGRQLDQLVGDVMPPESETFYCKTTDPYYNRCNERNKDFGVTLGVYCENGIVKYQLCSPGKCLKGRCII